MSPVVRGLQKLDALKGAVADNLSELTGQIGGPLGRRRDRVRSEQRRMPASPWFQGPDRRRAPVGRRLTAADCRRLWSRARPYLAPWRWRMIELAGLSIAVALLGVGEPLLMKSIVDGLGDMRTGAGAAAWGIAGLLAVEVARAALAGRISVSTWAVRLGIDVRVREDAVAALNGLPLRYHQQGGVGATLLKVNQHIPGFAGAVAELLGAMTGLAYFGLALVAMLQLEWRLTLAVVLVLPLPAVIGIWAAREQTERERRLAERWTRLYGRLAEVMTGLLTVKACGAERREQISFIDGVRHGNAIVANGVRRDAATGGVRAVAAGLARLVAIGLGAALVLRGETTLGTVMAFLAFVGGLTGPVQTLTSLYQTLRKTTVSFEMILDILDAEDAVRDRHDAVPAPPLRGHVRFEGVTFSHRHGRPTVTDVQLDVPAGETIAVVGPSGGGKSTLLQLLQRLHAPDAGRITIDGHDIAGLALASLRRQVGVVPQEAFLFNDTVKANIAYACPSATVAEIEAAARAANAHGFIDALPEGYETVVGERGSRLSGGQRQRIAIARALLQNPAILLLDEPTSALDPESEALVQNALARLTRGRTTFVIAHRLRTVAGADRIVVLDQGRVAALGTHDELLESGGLYAELVERELGPAVKGRSRSTAAEAARVAVSALP